MTVRRQATFNQKVAVSVVFVAAMFMNIIDITIVNVALPSLARDLHASGTSVSAVAVSYLVALAVVIPASGWLGDASVTAASCCSPTSSSRSRRPCAGWPRI